MCKYYSPYLSFCKNKQGKKGFLTISSKYIRRPQKRDHQTHPVSWGISSLEKFTLYSFKNYSPLSPFRSTSEKTINSPPLTPYGSAKIQISLTPLPGPGWLNIWMTPYEFMKSTSFPGLIEKRHGSVIGPTIPKGSLGDITLNFLKLQVFLDWQKNAMGPPSAPLPKIQVGWPHDADRGPSTILL